MANDLSTRILPDLYGCCDHPGQWRSLLDQICEGLGARSAAVQIYRREGDFLSRRWQERDSYSHAHASQHDRWINNAENPRLALSEPNKSLAVLTDDERFGPRSPQLAETRHRLAQVGLRGGTGILFEFEPSRYFSLILHRRIDDLVDSDRIDATFLREIGPHLLSLSRVVAKLQAADVAEAAIRSITDRLRAGILVCSKNGEVRWRNRAASEILASGASLTLGNGQLRGVSADSRHRLERLLSPACRDDMIATVFGSPGGSMVQAIAIPSGALEAGLAHGWGEEQDDVAMILIDPAQAPPLSAGHVMSLFGLTPAEAQLAIALSQGISLNSYADRRGISVGTVRIQMKRILEKTDSRRQADLVGKLYGSAIAQIYGHLH